MSIPTSLIVVLLVVAWLVVLVPMVARRRERVPQAEAETGSSGFRVLRRASAALRRRPARRPKGQTVTNSDAPDAPKSAGSKLSAQTTTTQGFAGGNVIDAPEVLVTVGADHQPQDAAEEWAAAHAGNRVRSGSHPAFPPAVDAESAPAADDRSAPARPTVEETVVEAVAPQTNTGDRVIAGSSPYRPQPDTTWRAEPAVAFAPDFQQQPAADEERRAAEEAKRIPDEVDEQEWTEHTAAAPTGATYTEVDDEHLRPVPHRRGRGGFDPEAAEVTRAYKYQQRRRVTLILFLSTVVFTLAAIFLINWLWVGAVVSLALLVGYLAYLRRQVRIEASIRQRRMERLQRARQIRPESGRPARRARTGTSAVVPGRTVVDLDDDDPAFDDLDEYQQPVTYRRASGQ
jgi:hypothetical protein